MPKDKRPKREPESKSHKRPIEQYDHKGKKRINNPPVGLVTAKTDPPTPTHKTYEYDPHLDPQLVWAGKKEHASFEVPTVSLHVHERIDPRTIIEAVRKRNGVPAKPAQGYLFETREENPPLREAIDFYRHSHGWTNRLIAGDSLLVMNSLLEKEGMAGQVQMVYIDPPYGIRYGSNFQPFVNRRDVKDGKDEDLTQEPEMVRAFRDTWELGIHSYLTYLRDRLLLARDLLHESGSIFVQISDSNVHRVRDLLDEVLLAKNFVSLITFSKTTSASSELLPMTTDYILWYARDISRIKYRPLYLEKTFGGVGGSAYTRVEMKDGSRRFLSSEEKMDLSLLPPGSRVFALGDMTSQRPPGDFPVELRGEVFRPRKGYWKTGEEGMAKLKDAKRLEPSGDYIRYVRYFDDFPAFPLTNLWADTGVAGFTSDKVYVVQTTPKAIQRCLLLTTDPGDLVLDPTCGSGTTAFVAEQWGRRWITCDTSRVATTLAKQRLMGATFDYYKLAHPSEGVGSGFEYKKVPHVTLKSIANNEPPGEETLYDQPLIDNSRARISGPFTVEAVPAPNVKSIDDFATSRHPDPVLANARPVIPNPVALSANPPTVIPNPVASFANGGEGSAFSSSSSSTPPLPADASIARSGPTLRQSDWRDELLKTGIRGKGGQMISFSRVEPLGGTRWLHADAETKNGKPERVVISFGPDHAPLEPRQVEMAWEEARTLSPKPDIIVFAAFQFDPEAAKDIDDLTKEKTGMTFLTAQMNADLLTDDLKKKRSSNQSFWLVGRPDVEIRPARKDELVCHPEPGRPVLASAPTVIPNPATLPANPPTVIPNPVASFANGGEGSAFSSSHLYIAEVRGFDYYNTRTGAIESGDTTKIAMWLLDTDYDGRSLYPRQVFFPLADEDEGWAKLARNLKAEIDPELIEHYRGTVSLPFALGDHKRVAVKVIDDRGIESLKVLQL